MNLRKTIFLACLFLCLAGVIAGIAAKNTPVWKDLGKALALQDAAPPDSIYTDQAAYKRYNQTWHNQIASLRTLRYPLFDLGSGLIALAVSIAATAILLRIRTCGDVITLTTPRRWIMFLIAVLWWPTSCLTLMHQSIQDVRRFEVPPWADSIAIPFFEFGYLALVGTPILALMTWLLWLIGAKLPVSLWCHDPARPLLGLVYAGASALLIGVSILGIFDALRFGPYSQVPCFILLIWLALALRAAGVSRFLPKAGLAHTPSDLVSDS